MSTVGTSQLALNISSFHSVSHSHINSNTQIISIEQTTAVK